jgi:DNA polymerase I-like protein with 3'-5' exonuclease and polymerase domains
LCTADVVPLAMVVIHRRLIKEGLTDVKMINQVHDSIIFDSPSKDVDKTCAIAIGVFKELPILIEKYFGFPVNVPFSGEAKIGNDWNNMTKWKG